MTARKPRSRRNEAGFTLLDLLFVIGIIGLLASLAVPGLMQARTTAQAASALGTINTVNSAQLSFAITCGLGFYAPSFPLMTTPPPGTTEAFLSPDLATGLTFVKGGYLFSMAGTTLPAAPATCNGNPVGSTSPAYAMVADFLGANPNARFFGTNADGIIYEHHLSLGAIMPETGAPAQGRPIQQ